MLDYALALVARRQVNVNIRPLAALFGQKPLEEQFHAHRIDSGDAQRIADGAVGSGPTSLRQDILLAAVADDVPDDQKIARQIQLLDHSQLALNLLTRAFVVRTVAAQHAFARNLSQELHLGHIGRRGIAGELVSQVVEREFEA